MSTPYRETTRIELKAPDEFAPPCVECGRARPAVRADVGACAECVGRAFELVVRAWPSHAAQAPDPRTVREASRLRRWLRATAVAVMLAWAMAAAVGVATWSELARRPVVRLGSRAFRHPTARPVVSAVGIVPAVAAAGPGGVLASIANPARAAALFGPGTTEPASPRPLALVAPWVRDPYELAAAARSLAVLGADVTVAEVRPSAPAVQWVARGRLGARIVPHETAGAVDGVGLYAVRPDSLAALVGLQSGDVVVAVNGIELSAPAHLDHAAADLARYARFVIEVRRGDRWVVLDVVVPPALLSRS